MARPGPGGAGRLPRLLRVANPALARTCIVESVTAGPVAMERYERALQTFVPLFREGRELGKATASCPTTSRT